MLNDDLLDKKLKEMTIESIDVTSKVMDGLKDKKSPFKKRIILIAAMLIMIASAVFAANWINFFGDDSYSIRTEDKQWYHAFDYEVDEVLLAKYTDLQNSLIETAKIEEKDLIGYYKSEGDDQAFLLVSNRLVFYPISQLETFFQKYDHPWIEAVKSSMVSDYSLSGASVNTTYSEDYFESWIDYAKDLATDNQLFYEENSGEPKTLALKLRYTKLRQGTLYKFNASIVFDSSYGTTDSVNSVSELVNVGDHQAVLTTLDGNYKLLELEYNNNLLSLHAKIKTDSKETLIGVMSEIIRNLEE